MTYLKARSGSVRLRHLGDLEFGDISQHYIYTKKLTIYNLDPIPTGIKIYWRINNSNYNSENSKHLPYCIYL